jgi:hypothetical protein
MHRFFGWSARLQAMTETEKWSFCQIMWQNYLYSKRETSDDNHGKAAELRLMANFGEYARLLE